jgi:hypothetical protein
VDFAVNTSIQEGTGMRKSAASSFLVGMSAMLLVGSPVWSDALTSVITDPVGDFFSSCGEAATCQPYQDILRADVAKRGGMFLIGMTVAERIPDSPPLQQADEQIEWAWGLDTNPATFPKGFVLPPGLGDQYEFHVRVVWDGTIFTAMVIDRRPLLLGEQAVVTPVPFKIKGADITVVVDESLIADPSSFEWGSITVVWRTEFGTLGLFVADVAFPATWPS